MCLSIVFTGVFYLPLSYHLCMYTKIWLQNVPQVPISLRYIIHSNLCECICLYRCLLRLTPPGFSPHCCHGNFWFVVCHACQVKCVTLTNMHPHLTINILCVHECVWVSACRIVIDSCNLDLGLQSVQKLLWLSWTMRDA